MTKPWLAQRPWMIQHAHDFNDLAEKFDSWKGLGAELHQNEFHTWLSLQLMLELPDESSAERSLAREYLGRVKGWLSSATGKIYGYVIEYDGEKRDTLKVFDPVSTERLAIKRLKHRRDKSQEEVFSRSIELGISQLKQCSDVNEVKLAMLDLMTNLDLVDAREARTLLGLYDTSLKHLPAPSKND